MQANDVNMLRQRIGKKSGDLALAAGEHRCAAKHVGQAAGVDAVGSAALRQQLPASSGPVVSVTHL